MNYRYKKGSYVEDSTKGKSLMRPEKFKGDVLVQVWMDSRVMATLSNWLDESGDRTRHMSEIVKGILEAVTEQVVNSGDTEMIEDTSKARDILRFKYRVNLNPSERGMKNVLHNQILTDRIVEGMRNRINVGDRHIDRPAMIPSSNDKDAVGSPAWMEEALRKHDEIVNDEIEQAKSKDLDRINELGLKDEGEGKGEGFDVEKEEAKREKKDKEYEEKLKSM